MYLLYAAVLPAIALCVYVYKKDKVDKEPPKLLALLFAIGALSTIPVIIVEMILDYIIIGIFGDSGVIYHLVDNFIGVALVEEGFKFLVLYLMTRNNRHFNSLFDGLLYSVFISLGFAAFENILYVFQGGLQVALIRAVSAIPGHTCFGVLMGYFYSMWHMTELAKKKEDLYKRYGLIHPNSPPFSSTSQKISTLAVPIIAHGFYDFCLSVENPIAIFVFAVFVIAMFIYCFVKIREMSKNDLHDSVYAGYLLIKKYPDLPRLIWEYNSRIAYNQSYRQQ